MEVYLDNSATTIPFKEVVDGMVKALTENFGNPSSLHRKGIDAEKLITEARKNISETLQTHENEIIFTSGGTESNNLAIKGSLYSLKRWGKHLITTKIEHPSVLNVFKELEEEGFDVTYLDVDPEGIVDLEHLKSVVRDDTIFVSVMHVNNEVGSIQPIQEISEIIKNKERLLFHVDAVQGFMKVPLKPHDINIDFVSMSSHKIGGPKGIGALYIKKGSKIKPIMVGGGQERNLRSGTENVPGIYGFGLAVKIYRERMDEFINNMKRAKLRLANGILSEINDCRINGPTINEAAPHILNVSFLGVRGEVLLHELEEWGIYVSTGSACSSKHEGLSHVLKAMGLKKEEIEGAIRFSFSPFNTEEEMDYVIDRLKIAVNNLRKFKRR